MTRNNKSALAVKVRAAIGCSQREFANLLGVRQASISRWESGKQEPCGLALSLLALISDDPRRALRTLRKLNSEEERCK